MRLPCLLLLLIAPAFAAAAPAAPAGHGTDSALNEAEQESVDAARLQRQELKSRERALEQQQRTTNALMDKQQQYLDDLQKQLQRLKARDNPAQNGHSSG